MVGFDTKSNVRLSSLEYAFAGGLSGALTRCLTQPLDVIKIRFQLQTEPISRGSKYTSVYQATRTIIKDESLKALWSGHYPAQLLSISYGISQFWSYEMLTAMCYKAQLIKESSHNPVMSFVCGSVAGAFATLVSFPFDTIRTRLVAEDKSKPVYKNLSNAFLSMCRKEGFLSLYKGLFPTVAQVAPHAGVQFMSYKMISEIYQQKITKKENESNGITIVGSLTSGSLAGLIAKTVVYPFDLAKKRLQIQGFQHHRIQFGAQIYCEGFFSCIQNTLQKEGLQGLYKGIIPSLYKAILVTALHFSVYEETCKFLCSIK